MLSKRFKNLVEDEFVGRNINLTCTEVLFVRGDENRTFAENRRATIFLCFCYTVEITCIVRFAYKLPLHTNYCNTLLPLKTFPKHPSPISFKNFSVSRFSTGTVVPLQAEYWGFGAYRSATSTFLFKTNGDGCNKHFILPIRENWKKSGWQRYRCWSLIVWATVFSSSP